jgi:putative phage-type endonuclease
MNGAVVIPNRGDWLAWRREGIGGSDAAVILGLDAFRSPVELWLDKLGQLPDEPSEAMELGKALEPVIAERFEQRTGLEVNSQQLCVTHRERPWMRATIDGLALNGEECLYEAKATSGWAWREGTPDHVMVQIQHSLEVCDLERCYLAVLRGDRMALLVEEIQRDRDIGRAIVEAEEAFWTRYVVPRVCPPALGTLSEEQSLRAAYSVAVEEEGVDLDPRADVLLSQYRVAKAAIKEQEKWAKAAQNTLMAMLGNVEVGRINGVDQVTWRNVETQRVDVPGLRKAEPELVERFTKISKSRRFLVAGSQEGDGE